MQKWFISGRVYRPIYFECIDYIVSCICDHFNQPRYIQLVKLVNVLVKAAKNLPYQEDLDTVVECYGNDLDVSRLSIQLQLFTTAIAEFDQLDICTPLLSRAIFSQCVECYTSQFL